MADILRSFLRILVTCGVFIGLSLCFYAGVNGDWITSLIALTLYAFSLLILA